MQSNLYLSLYIRLQCLLKLTRKPSYLLWGSYSSL